MQKLTFGILSWVIVALATFNNNVVTSASNVNENFSIDRLNSLGEESNRLSPDPDDQKIDRFIPEEINNDERIVGEVYQISNQEGAKAKAEADDNETIDYEALRKQLRRNRTIDILVGCFFFVAAVWLLLATCYSIILLILLRLQARGELDVYDENLGRVVLFNGKVTLHFGCILRRYAVQLEEDYQRQLQSQFGDGNTNNEEQQRIRIMTREERREALEELLSDSGKTVDVECGIISDNKNCTHCHDDKSKKISSSACPDTSLSSSDEEPVCSICLVEYEPTDAVFRSKSCPHMFHRECLFSWLERRNNTECPICRAPLVSDNDVWDVVQRMRKERRKALRKENGLLYRLVKWSKSRSGNIHPGISLVETDRSDSSGTSLSRESDEESIPDQISPPLNSEDPTLEDIVTNTNSHEESSSPVQIDANNADGSNSNQQQDEESSPENDQSSLSAPDEEIVAGNYADRQNEKSTGNCV